MRFPVAYRVAGLKPSALSGVRFHGEREGGDLEHITPPEQYAEAGRNAPVVILFDENGKQRPKNEQGRDWVRDIRDEINGAAKYNTAAQVQNLEAQGKHTQARRRKKQGDKKPWKDHPRSRGPLREVVLSANALFFEDGKTPGAWDLEKVQRFMTQGLAFLKKEWGDSLRYVRFDLDEGAPHIHAVCVPWVETQTKTGAKQRMLAPGLRSNYDTEAAQERAGEAFAPLGLIRGRKTAQARREAKEKGEAPPPMAKHKAPAVFRREQAAAMEAKALDLAQREAKAAQVLALAAPIEAAAVGVASQAAAVRIAQQEAAQREAEKAAAVEEAKKAKAQALAEQRRRDAIARAARESVMKQKAAQAAKAKARKWNQGR